MPKMAINALDTCRICFSTETSNDISELTTSDCRDGYEVISFCLDIKVTRSTKMRKLCVDCYDKILSFYSFKLLALNNNSVYLRDFNLEDCVKAELSSGENEKGKESAMEEYSEDSTKTVIFSVEIKAEQTDHDEQAEQYEIEYLENWDMDVVESGLEHDKIMSKEEIKDLFSTAAAEDTKLVPNTRKSDQNKTKMKPKIRKRDGAKTVKEDRTSKEETFCDQCGKIVTDMEKHVKDSHTIGKLECDICNKSVKNVKKHIARMHRKESLPYICNECGRKYYYKYLLAEHIASHEEGVFQCDICHKTLLTKKKFLDHKLHVHHIKNASRKSKNKKCDQCGKSFRDMEQHVKRKHLKILAQCDICNKGVNNIKKHKMVVHHKEQLPFSCSMCERKFIDKYYLERHVTTVHKKAYYECDVCSKVLNSSVSLANHKSLLHIKGKTFLCHICSKPFYSATALTVHTRSHTGERPFRCDVCGRSYRYKRDMVHHMSQHTGVRHYCCPVCGQTSSDSSNHKKHMRLHSQTLEYPKKKTKRRRKSKEGIPLNELRIARTSVPFTS